MHNSLKTAPAGLPVVQYVFEYSTLSICMHVNGLLLASKFNKLTKFKSSTSFESGLKTTIDYYVELMTKKNLISQIISMRQIKSLKKIANYRIKRLIV